MLKQIGGRKSKRICGARQELEAQATETRDGLVFEAFLSNTTIEAPKEV